MKVLFWILAAVSVLGGLFISAFSAVVEGLGLSGTQLGDVVCVAGKFSTVVCIVCVVIGIFVLRKGNAQKAVITVLLGVLYCAAIFGGLLIDDVLYTKALEDSMAEYNEQLYGEGWDSAPAMEGIPELYQDVLNEFYVVIKDDHTESLMGLGATVMPTYYADAPLDNIGFMLSDFNGDGVDELLIGTTAPVEEGGTAVICIYSDPENPHAFPLSVEGETHYLHAGEAAGSYLVEISDVETAWVIEPAEEDKILSVSDYQGDALNAADRLVFDLIPFSQYK